MPILESERLQLRPPEPRDVAAITAWIGDWDVARNLSRVPHPYREADAEEFVVRAMQERAAGSDHAFAILRKEDGMFLGIGGLHPARQFEFGYWIAKPYWGRGYASEAAGLIAEFGFEVLGAPVLRAGWFFDNPASGGVLAKLGARPAGSETRDCASRAAPVLCHLVELTRDDFERNKAARAGR